MNKRSYLRYLNPNSGKYEAPMLEDVGDIAELKTEIKTSLVAAINYLYENGVPTEEINGKLSQIETLLGHFSNGQWTDEQLQSLIGHVNTIMEIPLTEFQKGIADQKALWDAEVQQKLEDAKEDYNDRLDQTERVLTDAGNQLDSSRLTLEQATSELNNMTLNVAGYEEHFNEIDNALETVVYENKFDLMTSEFVQNKLVKIETAEGVIEESIARILSAVDGRVAQTESDYVNLTSELSKRISFQELKGELDKYQLDKYGDNLLEGTRDYRGWELNGAIPSAGTDYGQTKTVTFLSSGQQIESTVTGLKVGETYSVSVSMYYEEDEVLPTPVLRTEGNNYSLTEIYEDTRQLDNWIRVYTHFVAEAEEQSVAFFVSGIPLGKEVKLAGLKIEYDKVTPWKPHIEDTWYELELFDSKFIQQANAITSWLRHIAEDEDGLLDEEALWQVTAEGLLGQARTAKKLVDGTYQQEAANLTLNSSEFSTKVGKTVSNGIESINFDNRNRVINSNFQFNFEQWEKADPAFTLEKVGDHNYATVRRSGLTANNPVVLKTNKFKVTDLETLAIGLSVLTPNLSTIDVDTVMRLEIFDINDIRVALQDFTLSSMTGSIVNNEPSRLITKYKIDNNLAAKGQITLQLPRNGQIGFSQISIQNSDINVTDWAPAPEDIMMIQLRMDSWIEQDAESVAIGAIRQEIEKGKEDDTSAFHEMWAQIKVTADNFELAVKKDGIVQSINGSNEGLKIDFEKVNITGELIAGLISGEHIRVSETFRVEHDGTPLMYFDKNGLFTVNASRMLIHSNHVLTTEDKDQINKKIDDSWIYQDPEGVIIGAISQELEKSKSDPLSTFSEMWSNITVNAEGIEAAVSKDGVIQSINLSNEEALIDFDKVRITGELLASLISAEKIDITDNFGIYYQDRLVFGVDAPTQAIHINSNNIMINGKRVAIIDDVLTVDGKVVDLNSRVDGHDTQLSNVALDVDAAIAEAEAAKLAAQKAYEDAVAEAKRSADEADALISGRITTEVETIGEELTTAKQTAAAATSKALEDAKAHAIAQDAALKTSIQSEIGEVETELSTAKQEAINASNKALTDAKAHAIAQDTALKLAIQSEIDTVGAEVLEAKQEAQNAYTNAVAEAEAKVQAKDEEYKLIFGDYDSTIESIEADSQTAKTKAEQALLDVGISNDLAQTAKDLATTAQSNASTALSNSSQAKADAQTAVTQAGQAVSSANTAKTNAQTAINNAQSALTEAGNAKTTADTLSVKVSDLEGEVELKASQTEVDGISGTVSTHTTTLSQHATAIASKAEKTVVDTLSGTVSNQGTLITQNATDIASKASSSSVSTLTGRVSTAETTISQHATAIESKASQTEVDTVKGTVSSHTSTLSQHASEISARLTSSQVNSLVDGKGLAKVTYVDNKISTTAEGITGELTKVEGKIDGLTLGGTNMVSKLSALDTVSIKPSSKSKWGFDLRNEEKGIDIELITDTQYILSFVGKSASGTQNLQVYSKTGMFPSKTIPITAAGVNGEYLFTTTDMDLTAFETAKKADILSFSRMYLNSPMLVSNPLDSVYANSGVPNPLLGGMFNNSLVSEFGLRGGTDSPATAWAGINLSILYRETGNVQFLNRAKLVGNYFVNNALDGYFWGTAFKYFPNTYTYEGGQWTPATRFVHMRTFYHVAWSLLEIYDITKDTRYSTLAGQLIDSATMFHRISTGQANSNEIAPWFKGAIFNTINNAGGSDFEPDYLTFANTTGDVLFGLKQRYVALFGNASRTYFDQYDGVNKTYTLEGINTEYMNHLKTLYDNHGLRATYGHKLLYNFSRYDWGDEPHSSGYYTPIAQNWDFIEGGFGRDKWFTGDLEFWAILSFIQNGYTDIGQDLLDQYYKLRSPDPAGRLLFYDRYTESGGPMPDDQSKSTTFTALYMQGRNLLGDFSYDGDALNAIKHYQIKSSNNTIDGGFGWDAIDPNALLESKTLGEIVYSYIINKKLAGVRPQMHFKTTSNTLVEITDIQVEEGNKKSDWKPSPKDTVLQDDFSSFKTNFNLRADGWDLSQAFVNNNISKLNTVVSNVDGWANTISYVDENTTKINQTISQVDSYKQTIGTDGEKIAQLVMTDGIYQTTISNLDIHSRIATGLNLSSDPMFEKGMSDFAVYDNSGNGNVTLARTNATGGSQPTGKNTRLQITVKGEAGPGFGGVIRNGLISRANAEFVIKFTALLPSGRSFTYHSNSMGTTGFTHKWLTSNAGTGNWEEYAYYYKCGASGTFSSFGHLAVTGGSTPTTTNPFIWYIAKHEVYDISGSNQSQITQLADSWALTLKSGNDIKTQINASTDAIRLTSKFIHLNGNSLIDDATIKSAHIDTLNASKIVGNTADFNTIRTGVLTTDVVTATHIKSDTALIDNIFATQALVDRLWAKSIWTSKITTMSLNASQITAGTISAARLDTSDIVTKGLTANVVKSTHIQADEALIDSIFATQALVDRLWSKTIWANKISTMSLNASQITAGTINAARLNSTAIVTAGLSADVVTATHIKADAALIDSIFATQALVDRLWSKSIWTNKISAITLDASQINAGTINAARLNVSEIITKGLTTDVVTSTHIKADTALFNMLFSTTSATTRLVAQGAWITDANIKTLNVDKITGDKANFLSLSFESLNSNMHLSAGAIRLQNSSGDFATMNTIPEFRSQDSGGTAAIMGKGRSHYYSGNQSRFYIGSNLEGLSQYGIHIAKGQTFGIYRNSDTWGGTPAKYYNTPQGWGAVQVVEELIRLGYIAGPFATGAAFIKNLNGWGSTWPVLQIGEPVMYQAAVAGNESGVETLWSMGTSSSGATRLYSYPEHVFDYRIEVKGRARFIAQALFENNFVNNSDRRIKHDIKNTEVTALDHLDALTFKEYKLNSTGQKVLLGLIAQDSGILRVKGEDEGDYEGIDGMMMPMLAMKGVQELHAIVKEQAEEIRQLKEKINK